MSTSHIFSQLSLGGMRVFLLDFAGTTAAALVAAAHRILGREELALWYSFSLERKRLEWLAGRVVAKAALQDRSKRDKKPVQDWTQLQVLPKEGRSGPVHSPTGGSLSISHSGTVAVAVHSARSIGVDVEQTRSFSPATRRELLSHKEARLLRETASEDEELTLIWSTKEAVLKARCATALTEIRNITWQGWGRAGSALIKDDGRAVPFVHAGLWCGHAVAVASHDPNGGGSR